MVTRRNPWIIPILCGLGLVMWLRSTSMAQVPQPSSNLSLPVDLELSSALFVAEQAIANQEWDRAIEVLQKILDAEEDSFLSPDDPHSLQQQAEELLARLPTEGRQLYERQYSAAADALLASARQQQDPQLWSELVRRYFHTPAGREAVWRQARLRQDQGASLSAAQLFDKLLRVPAASQAHGAELAFRAAAAWLAAGRDEPALRSVQAWLALSTDPLTTAGRKLVPPRDPDQALAWLREQLAIDPVTVPGRALAQRDADPPRLAPFQAPSSPPAWEAAALCTDEILASYPERAKELNRLVARHESEQLEEAEENNRVLIPAASPLVVGQTVLYRGPDRLTALSSETGALLWTGTPVDFTYRELAEKTEFSSRDEMTRELYFGQRGWRDETSASLSTDGTLVYTVMDSGMLGVVDPGNPFQLGGRHGKGAFRDNTLQAYSLRGGKQRWSIGGPITPDVDPFGGLFFLGPPLSHEGVLYCLVEDRGQVRLLALDVPSDGPPSLLWSQSLLNPSPWMNIENHEGRRTAALQPIARGQVLICPTGAGSVVAVDLLERRLLWGTSSQLDATIERPLFRRPPRVQVSLVERQRIALDRLLDAPRWRGHAAVWVGDYVLVPTPDAENLTCLRASDGERLWTMPRGNWLYIAGCALDHVVLVGENQVGALWLKDGQPAWPTATPISTPVGRGVEHDGLYTFPTTTHELITFDLRTGQLVARSPVTSDGPLGNLVVVDGRLISQSASGIRGYSARDFRIDWLASIEQPESASPEDLAAVGESLLHAGQFTRGVTALRNSVRNSDEPRVRTVLAGALIERLRVDYSQFGGTADEIETLVAGTAMELPFHRLMVTASDESGDVLRTFRHLLRMSRLTGVDGPLEPMTDDHSVALERWIAGRLSALMASATEAERADMTDQLRNELPATEELAHNTAELSRLVPLLRGTTAQPEAELALARALASDQDPAMRLQAWLDVLDHADPAHRSEATARLAQLCLECRDPALAAPYVERLRTSYADKPTAEGRTGNEWLAVWEADPRLTEVLIQVQPRRWPAGDLDIRATGADAATPLFHAIPIRGEVRGPLAGWSFAYHDQKQQISAHTPLGEFAWETPAGTDRANQQSIPQEIMIQGPLVMVSWPDRMQVISAITSEGGRFRPVRSTRSHVSNLADFNPMFPQRGGMERVGTSGPLTRQLLCYHQGSELVGVDPWTGRDVWRRNLAGVAELLADEDYVVARLSRQDELLVLRAVDGVEVAQRPGPQEALTPPPSTDWGRGLMTLNSESDETDRLSRFDPVTGESDWSLTLSSPVYWTTVDGGALLVIDGDWTCRLIDHESGDHLAKVQFPGDPPAEPRLRSVTAVTDAERIYFVLNAPGDGTRRQGLPSSVIGRPVNGRLCAWSRSTGGIEWSHDVSGLFLNPTLPPWEWPVLVLAGRQRESDDTEETNVQVAIDKRTGQVLLEDRWPVEGVTNNFKRKVAWRVQSEGPMIRVTHEQRSLVIRRKSSEEATE